MVKPTYKELEKKIKEFEKERTEHTRVEEALKKSEQEKSAILDSMRELVVYQDTDHTVLWANRAAEESVGVAPETLVGRFCYEIWAQRNTPCEECSVIRVRETGHPQEAEFTTPDGRVWLVYGYPIRDANGIVTGAVETTLEITERKRMEETLRIYEHIISSTDDLMSFVDTNYMYQAVNEAYLRSFTKKREDIVGHSVAELMGKEAFNNVIKDYLDRTLAGEIVHYQFWYDLVGIGRRFMDVVYKPFKYREEKISGVVISIHDITERKHTEEELRESEERYRRLTENARDMIYRMSLPDGRYEYVSPASVDLLGYTPTEFYDSPMLIQKVIHPDWKEYFEEEWAKLVVGDMLPSYEYQIIHKSGETKWLHQRNVLISDDSGLPIAIEGIATDITERKQAEEALKSEKDKLQALMDGLARTQIGIDIVGTDYKILFQNQILKEQFGNLTGELCYEKYMGLEKPCDFCPMIEAIKSNKVESVQLTGNDGRNYELFSASLPNPDGTVDSAIEVVLDVTSRKQAQEALKESEEKYRDLFQNVSDFLCFHDLDGNLIETNLVWKSEYGFTEEDLAHLNIRDLIPERYRNQFKDYLQRVKENGKDEGFLRIITKDGSERIVEYRNSLVYGPTGPIGVRGSARDITSRTQAEKALKESEEKYRTLSEQSTDAIFITTRQGKLTYINQSFLDLFGYTKEEAEDLKAQDFYVNPNDRSRYQHEVEITGSVRDFEVKFRKKDGGEIDCLITSNILTADDGSIIGYQGIIRDITEKKNLEAQLLQAQKMEAIGTLAGGIAHNFNNLLMSIQGNTSLMLLDSPPDHPYYEKLTTIEKLVQSGSKLTSQLLGYARGGRYEVTPLSINHLIEETSATFSMTKKDITIHQELAKNLSGVKADQGQIEQVLLNIYVNAAEAMPHGGDLYISTQTIAHTEITGKPYTVKPGNYILLTLRDTGIGMDKATQAKVFDPFFTTKGLAKGTGLGLASVYGIMKAHGGYIDVESKQGHGTTFYIYLPASKVASIAQRAVSVKRIEIAQGKETVLLVDDEEMVLNVGEQILKKLGYTVLIASGGKEAVDTYKANKEKIDIVILDMIMPGMGGGETYDRMKEIHPTIKVLLSSGYSIDGQATEILKRGCDGFIQKPFTMRELSAAIREVLDKE